MALIKIKESRSTSDILVCVVPTKSTADLLVSIVESRGVAKGKDELWCYVESQTAADSTVCFVESKTVADLLIYFVESKVLMGCVLNWKVRAIVQHLTMQGWKILTARKTKIDSSLKK